MATPWGRLVFQRALDKDAHFYVEQLRRRGPAFINNWDAPTDARYPLEMATPSGNLLLVTDRKLPAPAQIAPAPDKLKATPGPNGLERARFRRAALWEKGESPKLPNISIGSLAAFDVDFRAPTLPRAASGEDIVSGQIEALIVPFGQFANSVPAPDEKERKPGDSNADRVVITRQSRRLVLPANVKVGELYRASVPLFLDSDSVIGTYQVWTRLVAKAADKTTPWTLSDEVFLTHR